MTATKTIPRGYVRDIYGIYWVQVPDPSNRWGFVLLDEDGCFEGGHGSGATEWTLVPEGEVPAEELERLEGLIDWQPEEPTDDVATWQNRAERYA